MSDKQHTLGGELSFEGKGLHTGLHVKMTFKPSKENTGIVFHRTDLDGSPSVPALCEYVTDTSRGTTIEKDGVRISTIEHVMSALWTMGVDNAIVEVNAPETPIMDGSAREYAEGISKVGLKEQNAERTYYVVTEKQVYTIPEKGVAIILYPDDDFSVSVHVDYNSRVVGNQYAVLIPGDDYASKIAPCRTFVFLHELEPLFKMNLIKGGDLDNAIVVVENPVTDEQLEHLQKVFNKKDIKVTGGYLNNLQLRANNELARHKLLDLLGDMALLGQRIKGRVWATRPGHFANTEFMKQVHMNIRREGVKPKYKYDPKKKPIMDISQIQEMLPHRYPMLLVDKIFHLDETSVAGVKNITINEPYFAGHFPQEPVLPGVLIIEAMAQCCGIMVLAPLEEPSSYSTYFLKIDNVRFRHKVVPGDSLILEAEMHEPMRHGMSTATCRAFVGEQMVCEAVIMAQIVKNK